MPAYWPEMMFMATHWANNVDESDNCYDTDSFEDDFSELLAKIQMMALMINCDRRVADPPKQTKETVIENLSSRNEAEKEQIRILNIFDFPCSQVCSMISFIFGVLDV